LKRIQGKLNSEAYQTKIVNDINILAIAWLSMCVGSYCNAPCHLSASTLSFLTERHINVSDWPANSYDANPVENLWHFINMKINDLGPMNFDQM